MPVILTENTELIKKRNDFLRKANDVNLSTEEREKSTIEAERIDTLIRELTRKKTRNTEVVIMEQIENEPVVEKPKKEKKKLIKEQVAELEENAYQYLSELCKGDSKVLVSLSLKLLNRFRSEKQGKKVDELDTMNPEAGEEPQMIEDSENEEPEN